MKSGRLSGENTLRLGSLGLCSERLSASQPLRSAVPLASAGIICLGLVPILGGPERPLHWAVTAGMAGFGVLLWARWRLRGAEAPLPPLSKPAARAAGRILLAIAGVIAVLVGVIVGFRVHSGEAMSAVSLALPGLGLAWLVTLSMQMLAHRQPPGDGANADPHPSRGPAKWEALSNRKSQNPAAPERQANA
jgi:hypothetical protein